MAQLIVSDDKADSAPDSVVVSTVNSAPVARAGPDHGVTKALAKAAITMSKADLWNARLAVKNLRPELREGIAKAAEG